VNEDASPLGANSSLNQFAVHRSLSLQHRQEIITEIARTDAMIAEAESRRIFKPPTFYEYVERNNPDLLRYEHIPKIIPILQMVIDGDIKRLLFLMPPRYFKSELVARLLPGCFLHNHPLTHVGLASYGGDLAWELSEDARDYFVASGGTLSAASSGKKRWSLPTKGGRHGGMWASGAYGTILGRGYTLGLVDDPTDPEKAVSPIYQRRFRKWWEEKFISRQEPNARIIVDMQRLGVEDPIDFLLRREVGENTECAPEYWHVMVLDEIHSDEPLGPWSGPRGLPPTCKLIPDWREVGELLAPTRFNAQEVERLQRTSGPFVTSSQRQQRPMRPSGDFWQKKWFRVYDELPKDAHNGGKDWDMLLSETARGFSPQLPHPPTHKDVRRQNLATAFRYQLKMPRFKSSHPHRNFHRAVR